MNTDFKWSQRVLEFCSKKGFEAGKILMKEGLPYVEIICSETIPNKNQILEELKALLPEGSKVIYKVDIKLTTKNDISKELESTRMPWSLKINGHSIDIRTMIPQTNPVWDKITELASKDSFVKEIKVKILDPDTIREAMAHGKGPKEAEEIAAESAEEFKRTCVSSKLKEEISMNSIRDTLIKQDDITNLKILLNSCNTVDDLLKSL